MNARENRAAELETVMLRADAIARQQRHGSVRPTHLVLAIMSDWDASWPDLIIERGGLAYGSALRRLGWKAPAGQSLSTPESPRFRSSMRLTLLIAAIVAVTILLNVVRRLFSIGRPAQGPARLALSAEAIETVRLAKVLAAAGTVQAEPTVGHLLLALASRPGEHLKVLPNSTVLGCEVRRRLGLATSRHRLILACDRPKLIARRIHMRIDREIASHGRRSRWGVAALLYGAAGALFAVAAFPVTFLATALLYFFLWPAALLMAGARALCGATVGCDARSYHLLKVPGGDVALTSKTQPASARAVSVALLAPRLLAALLCIVAMSAVLWQSADLGVVISPVLFRRPDILTGAASGALWLEPLSIFAGTLEQNGTAAGIGLLAGLGAGVMSVPTFHEVELIRLHAGHEAGGGSRLARMITAPASLFTGAVSCIEAVLPFTGAPIYATVYLVPLLLWTLAAIAVLQLLPY